MAIEAHASHDTTSATQATPLSAEDQSKDAFFMELARIGEAMAAAHGKDFAIGAHILAARFIAERTAPKPATQAGTQCCGGGCHDHDHHHKS